MGELRVEADEAEALAVALEGQAAALEAELEAGRVAFEAGMRAYDRLEAARQEHERLVAEGRATRNELERSLVAVQKLVDELASLDADTARLAALAADADGWREAEARLRSVEAVVAARAALAKVPVVVDPPLPDEEGYEKARAAAEAARGEVSAVQARLESARAERDRARVAVERSGHLTGEADCPLCGQALGDAFEAVQAHRAEELVVAEGNLVEAELDRRRAGQAATAATETASALAHVLRAAREAWAGIETARARRAEAEAALARAEAAHGRPVADEEAAALSVEVERRRRAADECQRIRGRIERRPAVVAGLDVERAATAEVQGRLDMLRDKVMSLAFRPEELAAALAARDRLRVAADTAALRAREAGNAAGQARVKAVAERRRLDEAVEQHAKLETLGDDARHLSRLADLLNAFRNTLVASVGPWLSSRAAELFAELTNREYDQLEINPETYEIKIRDAGLLYGMSRFSGSETDLANLALRVAVSEHVRFQAGAAVGLLVLDEVFGPLDDDRKELMLLGLERLKSRFRQILVVTHDVAIKEQLPSAIEVLKLPGRRASARLLYA